MRSLAVLLALVAGACAPSPRATMPTDTPTDTLRLELSDARWDADCGVLRLAGRVQARGPRAAGWTPAGGAQLTLRPPLAADRSAGSPRLPETVHTPYVTLGTGRDGTFVLGAALPDPAGYRLDAQWAGIVGVSLSVDSLLADPRSGSTP